MRDFLHAIWSLAKPYRARLALGVIAGLFAALTQPLLLLVMRLAVDTLFPIAGQEALFKVHGWTPAWLQGWFSRIESFRAAEHGPTIAIIFAACIPLVMFLRGMFTYLNIYFLQWAACRAITDLRRKLFDHLFTLPLSFFHKTSTGELMSRINSDVSTLQNVISNMTSVVIKEPFTLLGLIIYLLAENPRITIASLIVIPVCVVPVAIYSRKVRKSAVNIQNQFAEISEIMHESFTGARIIFAYNLEKQVGSQFASACGKYVGHYMRLVRSMELPGPLIEFFGAVGVALFLVYLAVTPAARTTSGDFLIVVVGIFMMYQPIKALTRLHNQFVQARAASSRVFEVLAMHSDLKEIANPKPLIAKGADIQFEGVHFDYGDKPTLRNINLTVKAGQLVALVGATGSGKTSLTNLLLRFYDPQHGSIKIGGTDLRDVRIRDLRNQIAVVTQETILFNDTIRNNIRMGRGDATDAEIEEAARHAHALEFIEQKPLGFDTVIGEKGSKLSGGQRQRLAIARAILKNAPILVLDEATSALDTEKERAVQDALNELMEGRTTICIAHRLSTVQHANSIVVLQEGQIVETGTHDELLKKGGVYHKLHAMQFRV